MFARYYVFTIHTSGETVDNILGPDRVSRSKVYRFPTTVENQILIARPYLKVLTDHRNELCLLWAKVFSILIL